MIDITLPAYLFALLQKNPVNDN